MRGRCSCPGPGWALGDGRQHADIEAWDRVEAMQLYQCPENEVVPCFYRRDESGLPREWIGRMRESMSSLTTRFSGNRMMREYVERYSVPLAEFRRKRTAEWQPRCRNGIRNWRNTGSTCTSVM
jgi:glycogen phosphorylase